MLSFWIPILISFIPLSFFAARVVLTNQLTTNNNHPDVPFCECVCVCVCVCTFSSLYCAHSVYIISTVYISIYVCAKVHCTVSSTLVQHCLGCDNKKKRGKEKKRKETTTTTTKRDCALFAAFEIAAQSAPLELAEGAPLATIGDTFR